MKISMLSRILSELPWRVRWKAAIVYRSFFERNAHITTEHITTLDNGNFMMFSKLRPGVNSLTICCMLVSICFSTFNEAVAASFLPIEILDRFPGGVPPYANPRGISPDGLRVVGNVVRPGVIFDCPSFLGCTSSFSWEKETGTTVGNIAGFPKTTSTMFGERELFAASMVATTNKVVLAHADISGGYTGPLLLTSEGPIPLSEERNSAGIRATAISSNGGVVIGRNGFFNGSSAFRWVAETGIQTFGVDNESSIFPNALSGNGQVIVGLIYDSPSPFLVSENATSSSFRWTESEGFSVIPSESEERRFTPTATSFDGSLIIGNWVDANSRLVYILDPLASALLEPRAVVWTEKTGIHLLDLPILFKSSSVTEVNDDGRLVIGNAILENPLEISNPPVNDGTLRRIDGKRAAEIAAGRSRAMLWDENRQAHDLQEWLVDNHHLSDQLAGWTLTSASAISANGRVIAGLGVNPAGDFQGWVVTIPEPCSFALIAFPLILFSLGQRLYLAGPLGQK